MNVVSRQEAEEYIQALPDGEVPADGVPDDIIADVSARMAEYTGREDWGGQSSRTQYLDGGTRYLLMDYWPIASVTSINDDTDHDFNSDSLISSDDYWISQDNDGIIIFTYYPTMCGDQNVKVVYTGGYASVSAIPANIKRAGNMQIAYEMNRRFPGTFTELPGRFDSAEFEDFDGMGLLASVRILLQRYKRKVPFA